MYLGEQTGESVKNMAQGAVDGVKNTLGMNEKKKWEINALLMLYFSIYLEFSLKFEQFLLF